MKILITGGLGFISSHLSKKLDEIGFETYIFDRKRITMERYHRGDINDFYSLEKAFESVKPDIVMHFAAMVSRKECEETPNLAILTNAGGTYNVCSLSLRHEARLIYAGSSEEYGTTLGNGKIVDENTPFGEPTSIYSMTKRMAEEIVQYYALFKGLEATTMRIFMLYGPGEEPSDYRSAIVRFTYRALKNQPLFVHRGTERSWCYIGDAINAMKLLVEREQKERYEVFNIGREDPISTELIAERILEICGSSSEIKKIEVEPTIIPVKRASFRKAKELLGWEAKVTLDEGLKKVTRWMRKYMERNHEGD